MTSEHPLHILRSAWVAPMTPASPRHTSLIGNGAVVHSEGKILEVGPADAMCKRYPDAAVTDLGDRLILPGLVNAHVHLELTGLSVSDEAWAGRDTKLSDRPARFVDWLLAVMAQSPPGAAGEATVADRTLAGIAQCLKFGVTTVGDITRFPQVTRDLLAKSPLRAVSFGEVTAMASRRTLLEQRLEAAMAPSPAPGRVISAVSPHAPYSIELTGYQRCAAAAKAAGVPIATHFAESDDEWAFLARHEGPFRRLWSVIGGWDDAVPKIHLLTALPEVYVVEASLNTPGTVLVHMNYFDGDFAPIAGTNVVYCPRTHAYFGHPPHPWREMLMAGINVAVGTDSTASSPDLNLVDDLRLLRRLAPDLPAEQIWELATRRAAITLGLAGQAGEITPGSAADFVVFPAMGQNPLAEILDGQVDPTQVWIAGKRVVQP